MPRIFNFDTLTLGKEEMEYFFDHADQQSSLLQNQGFCRINYPGQVDTKHLEKLLSGKNNCIVSHAGQQIKPSLGICSLVGDVPGLPLHEFNAKPTQQEIKRTLDLPTKSKSSVSISQAFEQQCQLNEAPDFSTLTEEQAIELFLEQCEQIDKMEPVHDLECPEKMHRKSALYLIMDQAVKVETEEEVLGFNPNAIPTDMLRHFFQLGSSGLTEAWLYASLYMSFFPVHVEDGKGLNSLNICYSGSGYKIWLIIPPSQNSKLFRAVNQWINIHGGDKSVEEIECNPFTHKSRFITTSLLDRFGVDYYLVPQRPGQIIITAAFALHEGINVGSGLINKSLNFISRNYVETFSRIPINYQCLCKEAWLKRKEEAESKGELFNEKMHEWKGYIMDQEEGKAFLDAWLVREKRVQRLELMLEEKKEDTSYFRIRDEPGYVWYGMRAYRKLMDSRLKRDELVQQLIGKIKQHKKGDLKNFIISEYLDSGDNMKEEAAAVLLVHCLKRPDPEEKPETASQKKSRLATLNLWETSSEKTNSALKKFRNPFSIDDLMEMSKLSPEFSYRLFKQLVLSGTKPDEISDHEMLSKLLNAAITTKRFPAIQTIWKMLKWDNEEDEQLKLHIMTEMEKVKFQLPSDYVNLCLDQKTMDVSVTTTLRFLSDQNLPVHKIAKKPDKVLWSAIRKRRNSSKGAFQISAENLKTFFGLDASTVLDEDPKGRKVLRGPKVGFGEDHKPLSNLNCSCGMIFTTPTNLTRHCSNQVKQGFSCWICSKNGIRKEFTRMEHYSQHYRIFHRRIIPTCELCANKFSDSSALQRHKKNVHGIVNEPKVKRQRLK